MLVIRFSDSKIQESDEPRPGVIIDYDKEGKIVKQVPSSLGPSLKSFPTKMDSKGPVFSFLFSVKIITPR
jgi:hypothetical protein